MNWRNTLWLVGATLALALFIGLVERPARRARTAAIGAPRVLPAFDPAAVLSLDVRASNGAVRIVRTNGSWQMASPGQHPANPDLIENLLRRIAGLRGPSVLGTAELHARPDAPAAFGLNPPVATLRIEGRAAPVEILIGARGVRGDRVYFQLIGVPGIFAAEAGFADALPTEADGWRDRTLVPLDRVPFDRFRVSGAGGAFTLARGTTNAIWEMTEPRPARADSARVDVLLRQLGFAEVQRFLAPTSAPAQEVAGLRPPRLVLSLARGTNELFGIAFGAALTNGAAVYAQRPGEADVLVVPVDALDILRISYKDLLDRRLLRFDPQSIRELAFEGRENFGVVLRPEGWRILPAGLPADPGAVERLVLHLSMIEMIDIAKEVVTDLDLATYGLAPPATRLSIRTVPGDTNSVAATFETGALRDNRVFARVPGEQPVYLLNPADTEAIPTQAWRLRDRTAWRFEAAQVASITIRNEGVEWTLRRQRTNDWVAPPGLRNDVNPFALDEALLRLGSTPVVAWIASGDARGPALGVGKGLDLTLEVPGNAATNRLQIAFGKRSPAGHRYAATTLPDGSRMTLEVSSTVCDPLWDGLGLTERSVTPEP